VAFALIEGHALHHYASFSYEGGILSLTMPNPSEKRTRQWPGHSLAAINRSAARLFDSFRRQPEKDSTHA